MDETPHHILELPHIPRPAVPKKRLLGLGAPRTRLLAELFGVPAHVRSGEQHHILAALPKRQELDVARIQPVEDIRTQASPLVACPARTVRRSNHAHVRPLPLLASDRVEAARPIKMSSGGDRP